MKKGSTKTTYFRKDYAPAKALARQKSSTKKSRKAVSAISKNLQKTATTIKKSAHKAATPVKNLSTKITNSSRRKKSDFIRTSYAKPQKKIFRDKRKREPFTWREYTLLSMISVSAISIAVTFSVSAFCDPAKVREQELTKIARDYYVEFLYPGALGKYINQPETVLKNYVDHGLPSVKLRQLLLYDNGKYLTSKSIFSNSSYQCDVNKSYVRYFPVAPYGPYDFVVHYNPVCEEVD